MKKLISQYLLIVLSFFALSCGDDEESACDQNATLESDGRGFECLRARATLRERGTGESLSVNYIGTDRGIIVFSDGSLEERTYEGIEEAAFSFNGIQLLKSVRVTITKLDRDASLASGNFEAEAEGTTSTFTTTGTFTDLVF